MLPRARPRFLSTFFVTLALSLPAAAQQADVQLPSLGSSADTVISPQEAKAYGAELMRELRAAGLVLDDPQVDQYLNTLGYRLASASADPSQDYTFTLINIPEINAFATFGDHVFIFSGMLTATQDQDQMAAVMAHELAHLSQHHLQRAIEDQKKTMPLYMLGAVAAALAASRVNPNSQPVDTQPYGYGYGTGAPYSATNQAAIGAFYSVLAMMQQHQIDFTRGEEAEADHVGIQTLARAGFEPGAMADIFARMQALIRPGGEGGMAAGNLPDFLQNHPVTSVRIADARARARVLDQELKSQAITRTGGPPVPGLLPLPFVAHTGALVDGPGRLPTEFQYELMRERVRVLSASDPRAVLGYYSRNMAGSAEFAKSVPNRYGYALALQQLGQASAAVPVMAKLVDADPGNLTLALGLADVEWHAGQRTAALQRYASLNAMWPNDPAIVLAYGRALLDDGSKSSAVAAQALLKPLLDDNSEPALYEAYGHACHVAGDEVHAGIAYADASFLSGHAASALDQLHRLLERSDLDYYTRAQINARIAQVTPIVLEIQRHHPEQNDGSNDASSLDSRRAGLRFDACAGPACSRP